MVHFRTIHWNVAGTAAPLIVLPLVLLALSGCSVSGYLIGYACDSANEGGYEKPKYHSDQFNPGQTIRVVQTDSTVIDGKFSTIFSDDSLYARRYRRAHKYLPEVADLPDFMDEVSVRTVSGEETVGKLIGYDIYFLDADEKIQPEIEWPESEYKALCVKPRPESPPKKILLKDIDSISYGTIHATAGIFREASESGTLPLRSGIVVKTERDAVTIPFDEAARIVDVQKTKFRWIFLGIGLAVDAMAVAYLISFSGGIYHGIQ